MADEMDARRIPIHGSKADSCQGPIRNRRDSFEFHAERTMIRDEFERIWANQKTFDGPTSRLLTDQLRLRIDDPSGDATWRCKGTIFGQRRTYWDTGTLGRCDLEPTDHCCSIHDMHAQYYRVVETVNNIRIRARGDKDWRSLTAEERDKIFGSLRKHKTGSPKTIRTAIGIDKRRLAKQDLPEDYYELNIERDEDREINTDCFYREIISGVWGPERWAELGESERESVNSALLKFDPDNDNHEQRLRLGAGKWWGLDVEATEKLIKVWRGRGRTDKRLRLSRRAVKNLVPYMERYNDETARWPTQIEARQAFAEDSGNGATLEQRVRYAHTVTERLENLLLRELEGSETACNRLLAIRGARKADRHYLAKHPDLLPPAPMLANPVVRKAIHEVRRHVMAHIRAADRPPDRVMIELARQARQSERVRNATLTRNRNREKVRKQITSDFGLASKSQNQQRRAQDRVILCRQQRNVCAYTGKVITDRQAALGENLEIDHIVPYSRCGDNSMNNRVLCYIEQNRGKGSQTLREWWGEEFDERIRPLAFMQGYKPGKSESNEYFTSKDYARKWENLTRNVRPEDEWKNSQLTDTAYAATQVMAYLRDALFAGDRTRGHGVFETNGRYTAMLRRDWQLLADGEQKDRGDHRHHAIDAAVIALTDPYRLLPELARQAAMDEEYHERTGHWPGRTPVPPPAPWTSVEELRKTLMSTHYSMLVSHRPVKRRIVGAFHEETLFGPVLTNSEQFTNRIGVADIKPVHLRQPRFETDTEMTQRLTKRYLKQGMSEKDAIRKAHGVVRDESLLRKTIDPPPGKSGIVRDRDLRRRLRTSISDRLVELGIERDADSFTKDDMKKLIGAGGLTLPSGVPIKSVILLRTMKDPVVMERRIWDPVRSRMVHDADRRTRRVYVGGTNHHIEIREDDKGGWHGKVVPMFDAAQLVRMERRPAVDRRDDLNGRFIMSLAEGETVHMCHPRTREPGYFVVFKLDKPHTIHFVHHWDARRSKATETMLAREEIAVTAGNLAKCGPRMGVSPYKVVVDPLGRIRPRPD